MQKQSVVKWAVALIVLLCVLGVAIYGYYKFTGRGGSGEYGASKTKEELMKEYLKYSSAGDAFKAYRSLKAASIKDPENTPLLRKAADAAVQAGKKGDANEMLTKVWERGYRDPKVLFTLVSTSILPKFEQRNRTLELIKGISEDALRKKLYALYYFQIEKYEKAEEYFNWLVKNDPHQVIYEYNARNLLALRKPNEAKESLEKAEKAGFLGAGGEIILANLYAVEGDLKKERKLFDNFVKKNGESDYILLSHAIVLVANNQMEEAKVFLNKISHPSRFSASNVSAPEEVISDLKNDPELAPLLAKLSDRTKDIIMADKQDIFEISLFSDYITQDFNRIAEENSKDSEEFLKELSKLHQLFDAEMTQLGSNRIAHQARIFLAPILYQEKDKFGLENLLLYASGTDRFYEGERHYINYFIAKLNNADDAVANLTLAVDVLGRNSMVMLTEAEAEANVKKYAQAIKYYSLAAKLNKTIGNGSYLLEHLAKVLADDEKYLASFELIRRMHNKRMISKNTLMLLRDVAYPAGFPEVSDGAQRVLEKKYGLSDDIVLGRAELRLKEGDAQAALKVFEELLAKGIEPTYEARLNSVMAESMLQLQMFEGVLGIVDDKNIDNSYKARALYGLGKHDEALEVFAGLGATQDDTAQWRVEYGLLLALKDREEDAALQFKTAIDENPKLVRPYVELASILLKHEQYEPAKYYAQQALELVSSLVRAKLVVANVEIVQGNNAAAEVLLDEVLYDYPTNIDALFLLSRSLLNQGETQEALDVIDKCLQLKPMYPLFFQQKIDILVGMDKIEEAVSVASLGVDSLKNNGSFEHVKIALLLQLGRAEEAFEDLEKAKNITGTDKLILESQVLEAMGKSDEAITKLMPYATAPKIEFRIVELMIKHSVTQAEVETYVSSNAGKLKFSAKTFLILGMMAEEVEKYEAAKMLYVNGLELAPDELHLLNNYIWVSLKLKDKNKTMILEEADKAIALYPDNTMILDTCATAYNMYEMYDTTIEILRKNPALLRIEPSLYIRLGDAWAATGRVSDAKNMYEKVETAVRSSDELKEEAREQLSKLKL